MFFRSMDGTGRSGLLHLGSWIFVGQRTVRIERQACIATYPNVCEGWARIWLTRP
jgi:hypothetical protein